MFFFFCLFKERTLLLSLCNSKKYWVVDEIERSPHFSGNFRSAINFSKMSLSSSVTFLNFGSRLIVSNSIADNRRSLSSVFNNYQDFEEYELDEEQVKLK